MLSQRTSRSGVHVALVHRTFMLVFATILAALTTESGVARSVRKGPIGKHHGSVQHRRSGTCQACEPTQACLDSIHTWALRNGRGFWVGKVGRTGMGLKLLTMQLHRMLTCRTSASPVLLVDVGAGIHNLSPQWAYSTSRLHPDDSDSLWLLKTFKKHARVHAFDVSSQSVEQLRRAARERPMTQQLAGQLTVHHLGVGAEVSNSHVAQCGMANTWSLASRPATERCGKGENVNVTTLDTFAAEHGDPLYVKIDTEGSEFDVLQGMSGLLREQRVAMVSFEYAFGWDRHYESIAVTADQRPSIKRTLFRFQAILSEWGYDTYLINAPRSGYIALVPVYGQFWHPDWEICFNRTKFYGAAHCWNDLIAVRRCNACEKNVLLNEILPAAGHGRNKTMRGNLDLFPECTCF